MISTILAFPAAGTQVSSRWELTRATDLSQFLHSCERIQGRVPSAFQHSSWLRSWYGQVAQLPGVEPLLLSARAQGDPTEAMLLPMVRRREGRLQVAQWADLGVTDYNAPVMREGLQLSPESAKALARGLRTALRGCDVLRFDKMPLQVGGTSNPLVDALATQPSDMFGHRFRVDEVYADWMQQLGKHVRKEFERNWRVFTRHADARFVRATTVNEGLHLLRQLAALQDLRRARTPGYFLDQAPYVAFYEDLVREQLVSGRAVVTALMVGEQMVAGLFSIHDGERFTMLRVSMAGEDWKACAPGKLVLERTIAHMHEQGCREFDFAIGDYQHKRSFATTPYPLRETCLALTLNGLPAQAAWRLKRAVKAHPRLLAQARRLQSACQKGN